VQSPKKFPQRISYVAVGSQPHVRRGEAVCIRLRQRGGDSEFRRSGRMMDMDSADYLLACQERRPPRRSDDDRRLEDEQVEASARDVEEDQLGTA